ncbi:MAG: radical SAM protein [Nannocystaceae bacterium]|nr:radical SAM protein [bacterium]
MTREPCVLLISPGIIKWTDMDFGLPHLVSMGGYVQQHTGVRVELLDLNYEGGDHTHLLQTIESLGPHLLIGLSTYSSFDYMRVMALARFLRRHFPDTPLVTGGYHASALPDDVVFDGSPFDAVIVGEGEKPLRSMVETLLGGQRLEQRVWGPDQIEDLDTLPPYQWQLLDRYWPRATDIGRKFQIYLARGCPYHCTFCMERAKSGYKWRAYSSQRAVDELRRLSKRTDLRQWVINIADPLFGFKRRWRREVLEGILRHDLLPRQYWTLTRSDDLDDTDIELLAKARFSIGIGLESGSPTMLTLMQKGNKPDAYLGAMQRLARLSLKHGLNWASNVIVGHPGETLASMRETHRYLTELFTSAKETCGWLSIDPFRLYPGAQVHEMMQTYSQLHGTRFHHPQWWKSWYDGPFAAEHIDPSREVSFEDRVEFMHEAYAPLTAAIAERFTGQGRSVDRVFRRSLNEQARQMSDERKQQTLRHAQRSRARASRADRDGPIVGFPVGLHVRDPWVRQRESAVRQLLDDGVLRTADLVEAMLQVAPEAHMSKDAAALLLGGHHAATDAEGDVAIALSLRTYAMGLEALEPALGDRVVDATARSSYLSALLSHLVGERGEVLAIHPAGGEPAEFSRFATSLAASPNVMIARAETAGVALEGTWDGAWIGAALPRVPHGVARHLVDPGGRLITFVGPRFRAQDLVALTRHGDALEERAVARVAVPVLAGPGGWIMPRPRERAEATARP